MWNVPTKDTKILRRPNMLHGWPPLGHFLTDRKIVIISAIMAALAMDSAAIIIAGGLADRYAFGILGLHNPNVVYLVLPIYWLVAPFFRLFTPDVLRSAGRLGSITIRSLGALSVATGLVFVAALAFRVGTGFSLLESLYFPAMAVLLLAIGRALVFAAAGTIPHRLDNRVAVFGDGSMKVHASPDKMVDLGSLGWKPSHNRPEFLEHIFRTFSEYDRIVLAFSSKEDRLAWARVMQLTGLDAEMLEPDIADVAPIALDKWGGQPTLVVSRGPLTLRERITKRVFDLTLTLAAAPIWVPLTAILAVLVRLDSPGSGFFAQERVGRNNRHYTCYKLRTMRAELSDSEGQQSTERGDPRVTRLGAFLRRTSLDELPQLVNVLKGEMSLVGPRPHALGSTAEGHLFWEAVPGYWCRHAVKPGLTGLAQVRGYRGATTRKRDLELRISADLEYINSWSLWLDLKIVLQSIRVMMHPNAF